MKVLPYRMHLRQPLLASPTGGDPNNLLGLDYLPGADVRAMLIGIYSNGIPLDAADPDFRRLFLDGGARFLNAYPPGFEAGRGLPTPLSWHQRKQDPSQALDFVIDEPEGSDEQFQPLKAPFFSPDEEEAVAYPISPEREQEVHSARDRRAGRALGAGDFFACDALAADQVLVGAILIDEDSDADILSKLLSQHVGSAGVAKTAYGAVELERDHAVDGTSWREIGGDETEPDSDPEELVVTLLSDALLRDGNGALRADAEVLREALEKRLNLELQTDRAFLGVGLTGGFNKTWGLPLPRSTAIAMGSVFRFRILNGAVSNATLKDLEWAGLGERRAEGYGRVLVNWHSEDTWSLGSFSTSGLQAAKTVAGDLARSMAQRMAQRLFDARLERAVTGTAITTGSNRYRIKQAPPRSQLSRLRGEIQNELLRESPNPGCIADFLDDLQRTAADHFRRASISGSKLDNWLRDMAKGMDASSWQAHFGLRPADNPKVGDVPATLDDAGRNRYLLRFVDAVLAQAIKTAPQRGGNT